jgi:cytoskeleton protein RodZ
MAESLGSFLRQKRESLGLTLEEVERHTHIRVKHLLAIETDDLSAIPSVTQARGFIRNYATFLGVAPDQAAARTDEPKPKRVNPEVPAAATPVETPAPRTAPNPATEPVSPFRENTSTGVPTIPRPETYARPRTLADRSIAREWFRVDRIFGGIIILIIVALLAWGGYSMVVSLGATPEATVTEPLLGIGSETAAGSSATGGLTPTGTAETATGETAASGTEAPAPGDTLSESPIFPGTIQGPTASPTSFPTPLGGVYTDVRIRVTVLQRAYLMVAVDGVVKFSDRVLPAATYDFIGQKTVTIATGNGAGISVLFNGIDEGPIGRFGEVVSLTFTPSGEITPTPQATLTPTVMPTATRTITPTKSP